MTNITTMAKLYKQLEKILDLATESHIVIKAIALNEFQMEKLAREMDASLKGKGVKLEKIIDPGGNTIKVYKK